MDEKEKPEQQTIDNMLGTQDGMYIGHFSLDPDTTVTVEDLAEILRAMDIRFGPEKFAQLPKNLRKHFIVNTRDGQIYRYGRKPRHLRG